MYIAESMIDGLGLPEGKSWPTEDHRTVAKAIGLCNRNVTNRDTLQAVVEAVLKVPKERIRLVTAEELICEFKCPDVRG